MEEGELLMAEGVAVSSFFITCIYRIGLGGLLLRKRRG